jgi:hypothetical protein
MRDPKLERRRQEQREMYQEPVRPKSQAEMKALYERASAMQNSRAGMGMAGYFGQPIRWSDLMSRQSMARYSLKDKE